MKLFLRLASALGIIFLLGSCAGERAHREGLNLLADGKAEEGLSRLERAVKEEPENIRFRSDLLTRRTEQVGRLLASADTERSAGNWDKSAALYQRVLSIEAGNHRASDGLEALLRERRYAPILLQAKEAQKKGEAERALALLTSVLNDNPRNAEALALKREIDDQQIKAQLSEPVWRSNQKKPINLEFRDANLKMVLEALSRSTGVNFILDRDVRSDLRTTVFLRDALLEDAIELILQTTHLEKKVLNRNTVLIYPNSPEKLKEYQELIVKGFYLANADVRQTQIMLKNVLKTKDMYIDEKLNLLVMRDTPDAIKLASKLIAMHDLYEPEVMLEVEVLEVKRSRLLEMGVQWPTQLSLSPLKSGAVLSDLQHINSNSIGISQPSATINLRREIGDANMLANPRIRARNREKAKIMIGDKVPVVTATTSPTGFSAESVQYLDVGIKLDVEPHVYLQDEVAIQVGLEVSSIVKEVKTPNGSLAYQIGSRSASTVLRLKDGETQVLAGLISDEDRSAANRVPGLGDVPMLGRLFSSQKDDRQKTEIVLSITPRLVRNINRPDAALSEFWSGTETSLRTKPLTLPASKAEAEGGGAGNSEKKDEPGNAGNFPPEHIDLSWKGPAQVKVGEEFKLALKMKSDGGGAQSAYTNRFQSGSVASCKC